MLGMFSICRLATGEEGLSPRQTQPRDLGAATFGGKAITSPKKLRGFLFDVVRGYCTPPCRRMLRARWSVCVHMCLRALQCMWRCGGTAVKALLGQTFGCPWQCTLGGAGLLKGPLRVLLFHGTKASAGLIDVNSAAFVPKALRHAEWEIWPLPRVRDRFQTPLAVSGQRASGRAPKRRVAVPGCTGGREEQREAPSSAPASFDTTN